ncbi:Yip1 family protein [Paenibacillus septentrionalis]|uniref:Yip1 family protein n=1 Tax=Paenibacillus septentrionalis TaxID=429342 RepID=A0ABW1V7B6_9BACL
MKQDFFQFPLQVIVKPFESFWDMKYENRGKLKVAFTLIVLTILAVILQKKYAGFLVNYNDPRTLNSLVDIATILFPFFLWCVANWSITTLMGGEGKFKEIVLATAYSLTPFIIVYLPMTFISRYMANEEVAFYYLLLSIASLWFVWLLFVGIMTVHQYTVLKTVTTIVLTIIVMGIIVFLGALVFSMLQQMYDFIYNVYREILFRT